MFHIVIGAEDTKIKAKSFLSSKETRHLDNSLNCSMNSSLKVKEQSLQSQGRGRRNGPNISQKRCELGLKGKAR
jgi:hypothetical protein